MLWPQVAVSLQNSIMLFKLTPILILSLSNYFQNNILLFWFREELSTTKNEMGLQYVVDLYINIRARLTVTVAVVGWRSLSSHKGVAGSCPCFCHCLGKEIPPALPSDGGQGAQGRLCMTAVFLWLPSSLPPSVCGCLGEWLNAVENTLQSLGVIKHW